MKNNGMGMWMVKLLGLIPYLVSGIEQIHGDAKSGAQKKQLALEALGLASGGATGLLPESDDPAIAAATQLASDTIDGVKTVYNAAKSNQAAPAPAAPAPAAPATPAPAAPATPAPDSGN